MNISTRVLAGFLLTLGTVHGWAGEPESGADYFERHVRPLLVQHCAECHGAKDPEAGLSLTSREALFKGGQSGPAAVSQAPDESLLIQAIRYDRELQMPPDGKLEDDEIAVLTRWVEMGLPWPEAANVAASAGPLTVTEADRQHWAYRPVTDPVPPAVRASDWPQTSIDHFILARLEEAGLSPAPAADRRTFIRRAYYDLIGLPPTFEQIEAFVHDPSPRAFETVIDELLASPRYGERWGRHWLDVARFADTKDGVLMYGDDRVRPYAYTYRDYVIRAFNEDLPFDRFIEEQLAADRLEPPVEPWRLAAMGFLTLGRLYDNNIHDVIDDQIDTVTRGLLGLTVACARCHDHKYDAIPTADYYSLYGVFASSEAPLELPFTVPADSVSADNAFEKEAAPKRAALQAFLDEQFTLLTSAARDRVADYLVHVVTKKPDPLESAIFFLSLAADDLRPPIIARWRRYLELHARPEDPVFGPWHDLMQLADGDPQQFAAASAAVLEQWRARPQGTTAGQVNPLVLEALCSAPLESRASVAQCYGQLLKRLYDESRMPPAGTGTASPPLDQGARQQLLELVIGTSSPLYFPKSQTRTYMSRQPKDEFGGKIGELERMAVQSPVTPPRAMVLYDASIPYEPKIFVRGNPTQMGEPVPRRFLEVLAPGERTPFGAGSGRLELARAIASPDNPLTARVLVNRVWMYHMGEPLVSTPSDFGKRSTPPTHPELLDHLAARFMAEGWSLKRLHRWIMLSSVYQQSSAASEAVATQARMVDPENRLLWHMRRQRLDLEAMRDTLLAISGRLEHRSGGRPENLANNPQSRCRTVYGLVDRQSLPGFYRAFDFASPDVSTERRPRTMVAQQALFAMNSPFVIEQVRALAARTESIAGSDTAARIQTLYRLCLGRDATEEEVSASRAFVEQPVEAGSQLNVWEQLAQVLLSTNELMYID